MKPLRALVTRDGKTFHALGGLVDGIITPIQPFPRAHAVEIVQTPDDYYLYRLDAIGNAFTDTWHASMAEAKRQASFEYGINESDWSESIGFDKKPSDPDPLTTTHL
jgi:hypothetical protein